MRLTFCATVVSFCLAPAALADDTAAANEAFAEIAAKLAAPEVLRGNFEQTREIAMLSKPLESSGRFLLSDMGLYWQQDRPVASVMIADADRLLQSVGDGALRSIDVAKNPVVLSFSQSFLSIFSGGEEGLRENFDVEFKPAGDESGTWEIILTPTRFPMSEAVESIILTGREYIETLTVINRTSDKTVIHFSELQTNPDHLTEHEIELYAR